MKRDTAGIRNAQDLERKYNFNSIEAIRKNVELNSEEINKVNNELTNFANTITQGIQSLQDQVDGNISTWFYSGIPTLLNLPANEWITDKDKDTHLGDLYYDQNTGYAYRLHLRMMYING